jgi:hypothetical protein
VGQDSSETRTATSKIHCAHLLPKYKWTQSSPLKSKSKSKLYYDRQSVGQSVLVSSPLLGPATNFSPSLFDYSFRQFVDAGRPLWREVGSVLFSSCRASPAQPFSDQAIKCFKRYLDSSACLHFGSGSSHECDCEVLFSAYVAEERTNPYSACRKPSHTRTTISDLRLTGGN